MRKKIHTAAFVNVAAAITHNHPQAIKHQTKGRACSPLKIPLAGLGSILLLGALFEAKHRASDLSICCESCLLEACSSDALKRVLSGSSLQSQGRIRKCYKIFRTDIRMS